MLRMVRHSFFHPKGEGILRYSEYCPDKKKNCDHQVCNCTKNVTKRPEGNLDSVQQYLELEGKFAGYNLSYILGDHWFHFNLYWNEKPRRKGFRWKNPNACFMFKHNACAGGRIDHCMTMHCSRPGYGRTDCFFGNLYFGNEVNIDNLFNGHSRSRIVDLKAIKSNQIWAHASLGKEVLEFFPEGKESQRWWKSYQDFELIEKTINSYSKKNDLKSIYDQVKSNKELLKAIKDETKWFVGIIDNLEKTQLYKVCDKVYKEIHDEANA